MEIRVVKKNGGLYPYDEESEAYISKLGNDDFVVIEAKKKRNAKFHRKYYAMLRTVARQLDCKIETLHDFIKDETGRYDIVAIGNKVMKSYHSISFAKMDGIEFEIYYSESIAVLANLLGLDHQEILQELEEEYY